MAEQTDFPSPIAASLMPFVEAHKLAGSVLLVASDADILAHEAVGFADLSKSIPMKRDTIFWIASMTKPITSAALMMLVEEDRLNLNDPVERYLPEFKGQKLAIDQNYPAAPQRQPRHPITIREILSHTSGLPFRSSIEWPTLDRHPLTTSVKSYARENLLFEPGSKYGYSNEGTNTAGRIVEVISGQPYHEFLKERLLRPLQMTETTFIPSAAQVERQAKCYSPAPARTHLEEIPIEFLSYPLSDPTRHPFPGGGLFSAATDIARFCQMILRGGELDGTRYLSETSITEMTLKQTGPHIGESYGLGWTIEGTAFGHGGAHGTHMWIDTVNNLITIYLVAFRGEDGTVKESHDRFAGAARCLV